MIYKTDKKMDRLLVLATVCYTSAAWILVLGAVISVLLLRG